MCELLIRVRDKVNPLDPYKDAKLMKRGDVVAVVPDGHVWGLEELRNPDWRILRVPGVSSLQMSSFLAPEVPPSPDFDRGLLRKRRFTLDLSHELIATVADVIGDDKRQRRAAKLTISAEQLLAMRIEKTALPDKNLLD